MQINWNILSKYRNELYGFSIIWIILFHGLINIKPSALSKELSVLTGLIKHGNLGVEIFLFLSGISLYYSMKRDSDVYNFYIKRLKRIVIPFFIIDAVYWLCIYIINCNNIIEFIKNITFYSFWFEGNKLVWFIALIIPLYICYPILFKKILNNENINRLKYIMILCISIYILCYILKYFEPKQYKMIEIALTRIPVFILGSYCGILSYENKMIDSNIKVFSLLMIIVGFGYFYVYPIGITKIFRIPYLFLGPSFAIWVCICIEAVNSPPINRALSKCGRISLELYLSHMILREIFSKSFLVGNSGVANFHKYLIFVMIGAFVISLVVYNLEKYILGK